MEWLRPLESRSSTLSKGMSFRSMVIFFSMEESMRTHTPVLWDTRARTPSSFASSALTVRLAVTGLYYTCIESEHNTLLGTDVKINAIRAIFNKLDDIFIKYYPTCFILRQYYNVKGLEGFCPPAPLNRSFFSLLEPEAYMHYVVISPIRYCVC